MAEVEQPYIESVDLTTWLAQPVEFRATVFGATAMKSQARPNQMTNDDYWLMGLANKDPEARQFLQNDAINQGINWEEMFTLEAVFSSMETRDNYRGIDKGTGFESWRSGRSALPDSWSTTAIDVAGGIATVGLVGASVVMGTALTVGGGLGVAGWILRSVSAKAAVIGLAGAINHPKAMEAVAKMVDAKGFSAVMNGIRKGGPWVYRLLIAAGLGTEAKDIQEALTNPDIMAEYARIQQIAKLEAAGYRIEVPGQALSLEGETLAYVEPTEEDIVIYDPEGNLLSTKDKDALLDGGELPAEFVSEGGVETLPGETPPAPALIGSPELFGVADQYANVGSSDVAGPAGYQGALNEADAREGPTIAQQFADAVDQVQAFNAERDARYNENPYIGVARDYERVTPAPEGLTNAELRRRMANPTDGTPNYRQNDVLGEVAKWDTWDIIEFQEKALEAGLINPDAAIDGMYFAAGTLDDHTLRALESAMKRANVNGDDQTYDQAIDWIIEQRDKYKEMFGDKDGPPPWTPPQAYFDLDYATISNDFKVTMEQKLGRKANQWEIDLAADAMRSNHRAAYDEAMSADKAVYEAQGRAVEYDTPQQVEGSYTEVDEDARFAEDFRERYGTELDQRDRQIRMEEDSANLFGGLSNLSRLGGGV